MSEDLLWQASLDDAEPPFAGAVGFALTDASACVPSGVETAQSACAQYCREKTGAASRGDQRGTTPLEAAAFDRRIVRKSFLCDHAERY